ncbi:hypothetical protein TheveDRAFT_1601 [Thermanaerovibrio velox DSM 12556]|uniref:Ethanolamine utilization protein n=1 Tax=Thermanaerovibrio velox DSM 12556 TaxID=926567 RepID=H0UQ81_9BACT|nr:hypothetical protein [Thermanaerovibrio velox]EHM10719.1 hypothetical protein TheveDRAFT_1601 [Thermanaerovibrio velox DSM 12556]
MDQSKLIDQVLREVMRRLSLEGSAVPSGGPKVLVLGEPGCLASPWDEAFVPLFLEGGEPCLHGLEALVVPRLDQCQLVASSLGMWCDPVSRWLVEGLSMGIKAYVLREGLKWMDQLRPGSPLGNHYRECLDRLCAFGVRVVSSPAECFALPERAERVEEAPDGCVGAPFGEGVLDLRGVRLVSEREVKDRCFDGCREVRVDPKAIITPLCMDLLRIRGISVIRGCGG